MREFLANIWQWRLPIISQLLGKMQKHLFVLVIGTITLIFIYQSSPMIEAASQRFNEKFSKEVLVELNHPLSGIVLASEEGKIVRISDAYVSTGKKTFRTDEYGRFQIPREFRTSKLNIVSAGYEVVRKETTADYEVVILKPIDVRAIYISYEKLGEQKILDWIIELARSGVVNSVVIDVKNEAGSVLPIVANERANQMGAVRDPGTNVLGFLNELKSLGVYRIARVVTFFDTWLALNWPQSALRTSDGKIFFDSEGYSWTDPTSEIAREHNVSIGVNAAANFEEVQYDYIRLPIEPNVHLRSQYSSDERSAFITEFTKEAAGALHSVGAAMGVDIFGVASVASDDSGIGQILEDMALWVDYICPMIYPSTWSKGWFGLDYPAAYPEEVTFASVGSVVERLREIPTVRTRPWLQGFHDYGVRGVFYESAEVEAQIEGSTRAGGTGFMVWDARLRFPMNDLVRWFSNSHERKID